MVIRVVVDGGGGSVGWISSSPLSYLRSLEVPSSLPCLASSVNLLFFACRSSSLRDIRNKSSTKSKSSRVFSSVKQRMPLFSLLTVCCMIQFNTIRKMIGDSRQPCLTPACLHFKSITELPIVNYLAFSILIKLPLNE
ncbi:unnamed protein product, partial [Heterobilharzia americana]